MAFQTLKALQELEKNLREEFNERILLWLKRLIPELKGLEAERDGWKAKYEEQQKKVENLESFQRALEIQVSSLP
jgi:predicted  nucleic acid-binding Zn-ribbon protein